MLIRRLNPADVVAYRQIRLCALRSCPQAFGSAYTAEKKRPLKAFEERLSPQRFTGTFGAFVEGKLVGVVSLVREARQKEQHKANICAMFVAVAHRRHGVGRALMECALDSARRIRGLRQIRIAVVSSNKPAARLYESLGFRVYGEEKDALRVGGKFYDELFLALRLLKRSRSKPVSKPL
jgi:RimJ/RimL family protein N-acetyltransferase